MLPSLVKQTLLFNPLLKSAQFLNIQLISLEQTNKQTNKQGNYLIKDIPTSTTKAKSTNPEVFNRLQVQVFHNTLKPTSSKY